MPDVLADKLPRVTENEVETFSGQYVDVSNPQPETISLEDIAHALAYTCRYGGHCFRFYSVAEHAVFVSRRLDRRGASKAGQLYGLHHDDAEAYLGDIPRPLKPLLGFGYEALTARMDKAIVEALGLPSDPGFHRETKKADNWSLFVEAKHLLPSGGKGWWDGNQGAERWGIEDLPSRIVIPDYWLGGLNPHEAEQLYLERHRELADA